MRIGGFPTDSVTEDYLLTLRLRQIGYRTVYLNERLSLGLAPEGLREYIVQRSRWCLGFMQICVGRSGPLRPGNGLSLVDRLILIETFLHWAATHCYRLLGLALPLSYFLFGIVGGPRRRVRHALSLPALFHRPDPGGGVAVGLARAADHGRSQPPARRHQHRQGGLAGSDQAAGPEVRRHRQGRRPQQALRPDARCWRPS